MVQCYAMKTSCNITGKDIWHSVLCYLVTVLTGSKVAPVRKEPTETFCGEKTTEHLNKNAHVILYIHSVEK